MTQTPEQFAGGTLSGDGSSGEVSAVLGDNQSGAEKLHFFLVTLMPVVLFDWLGMLCELNLGASITPNCATRPVARRINNSKGPARSQCSEGFGQGCPVCDLHGPIVFLSLAKERLAPPSNRSKLRTSSTLNPIYCYCLASHAQHQDSLGCSRPASSWMAA
jgi:hypothetical protein